MVCLSIWFVYGLFICMVCLSVWFVYLYGLFICMVCLWFVYLYGLFICIVCLSVWFVYVTLTCMIWLSSCVTDFSSAVFSDCSETAMMEWTHVVTPSSSVGTHSEFPANRSRVNNDRSVSSKTLRSEYKSKNRKRKLQCGPVCPEGSQEDY